MYNAIIGTGIFTKLLIENFIESNKNIILISNKDDLEKFKNDASIIKKSLDIKNSKLIRYEILSKNYSKTIIYTDNDMLTLMLAESLKDIDNIYAIFNSKSINKLVTSNCNCLFIDEIFKKYFNEEIL